MREGNRLHSAPAHARRRAPQAAGSPARPPRLKADLAAEREKNKTLAKVAVELSLELEQVSEELTATGKITRLHC